jgi:hypothetical protein
MIQGDHGPVAFRNIKYRLMRESNVSISDISYKTFAGNFEEIEDFESMEPVSSGNIPEITMEVADTDDAFGVIYTGNINFPEDGTYQFQLKYNGGAKLVIDGQPLVDEQQPGQRRATDDVTLTMQKGTYPFQLYYYKDAGYMPPRLGFFSTDTYPTALHAFNSFPPDENVVSPIFVKVGNEPKLLRAFLDFKGDRSQRRTHTIGVGGPAGTHYIYDLEAGNLLCVWRGAFVDATPMWHQRGDGSFRPMGMVQYLFASPPLATLSDQNAAFPEQADETDFRGKGYVLEEATGRPIFKYIYKGMEVEDKVYPDDSSRMITREITVKNSGENPGLHYKLAEGDDIMQMQDGSYIVDDKQYYIKVLSSAKPVIREANGKKELVALVNGNPIKYSIIW